MAGGMFWLWLLACTKPAAVEAAPRPTLGVALPLSGPDAAFGAAALDGVTLAVNGAVEVVSVDDAAPGAVAALAAYPGVFGVVAHVTRATAEATADAWLRTDVPVVVAAPGRFSGLPRVIPPMEKSARCAGLFLEENFWVRTDGSPAGMAAGQVLLQAVPEHALGMETVDAAHVSHQAARHAGRARSIAWTGDAAAGGNYLRILRKTGADVPFLGVGLYDTRFLQAAGSAAEGTRVTSEGRPARNRAFVDAFVAAKGQPPGGAAVDAYEAATLLMAAWRAAGGAPPAGETAALRGAPTRAAVRAALDTVVAEGANGPMYLGDDLVLEPVVCAAFTVTNGAFVVDRIASEADILVEEEPDPPPKRRKNRR